MDSGGIDADQYGPASEVADEMFLATANGLTAQLGMLWEQLPILIDLDTMLNRTVFAHSACTACLSQSSCIRARLTMDLGATPFAARCPHAR